MDSLRFLFVIARYPPALGGTERQCALLAAWLARRGHRVTVATQEHPGLPRRAREEGVEVLRLPPRAGGRISSLAFDLRLASLLGRAAAGADLCQAFLASSPALVVRRASRRAGRPAFLKLGASGPQGDVSTSSAGILGRWKLARLRSGFARYLCPNEEIRRELLAAGFPGERLVLLPNGVDTGALRPPGPGERERERRARGWEGRPVALFAGRFEPQKNLPALLEAWGGVERSRPGALLVLAGEGAERGRIEGLVRAAGLGEAALLLPPQAPDGIRRLLACADLFVLPSLAEGLSNALLEAMASGVAPAVSDIPGNCEIVAPLGADLLFDPAAPGSIARVLSGLLADPGRRASAGAAARARVLEGYGLDAVGERYLALVREALGGCSGAPKARKASR